jgi:hypothetical protein
MSAMMPDDYSAQLKQKNSAFQMSASWLTSDLVDNNNDIDFLDGDVDQAHHDDQKETLTCL